MSAFIVVVRRHGKLSFAEHPTFVRGLSKSIHDSIGIASVALYSFLQSKPINDHV